MTVIAGKALVAPAVGAPFELQDVVIDPARLGPEEVVVKFKATGICHTDVSVWKGLLPGTFPCILGHEGAGTVAALPPAYRGAFQVGDTVLCTFNSCGACNLCKDGYPAGCDKFLLLNILCQRSDGSAIKSTTKDDKELVSGFFGQSSFTSHGVVQERCLAKVDASIPLDLVCSFGCGIQSGFGTVLNTLLPLAVPRTFAHLPSINDFGIPVSTPSAKAPQQPHTLTVFGLGAVGIGAIVAGHLSKTRIQRIVAVDLIESRLELARKAGATHVINAQGKTTEQIVEAVQAASVDGQGSTLCVEATGVPAVLHNAIMSLAPRGRCALVGAPPPGLNIDAEINHLLSFQKSVIPMLEGDSDPTIFIPYMIAQFQRGAFDIMKDLVKTYRPDEIAQAMEDAKSGQVIKPVIVWE